MGHTKSFHFPVFCSKCGLSTEKAIAWLVNQKRISCRHCGARIDLQSGDMATAIQKVFHQCAELDRAARARK